MPSTKTLLEIYAGIAALYYVQASRQGMNPSVTTALQWPILLLQTPSATLNVLTKLA